MPLALLLVGIVLVVAGVRNTVEPLGDLLKSDFTGPGNFSTWIVALVLAGAIGWIPGLRPLSTAFIVLILVSILLQSGSGFFDQFNSAMKELNQ